MVSQSITKEKYQRIKQATRNIKNWKHTIASFDHRIAESFEVSPTTVYRVRRSRSFEDYKRMANHKKQRVLKPKPAEAEKVEKAEDKAPLPLHIPVSSYHAADSGIRYVNSNLTYQELKEGDKVWARFAGQEAKAGTIVRIKGEEAIVKVENLGAFFFKLNELWARA